MAGLVKRTKRSVRRTAKSIRIGIIARTPPWLRRRLGPTATYFDLLFVDHGIFRLVYANCHKISDLAWRSAQPTPRQLRQFAKAGIRTIVNLRGPRDCGSYWL